MSITPLILVKMQKKIVGTYAEMNN